MPRLTPTLLLTAGLLACRAAPAPYDLVITGGRIVDGSGNPWFQGDVALRGDRIVAVTPAGLLAAAESRERIDAQGMVVAPGFIDIQSHSWSSLLIADGRVIGKVAQGVTTEILGESTTPAPSNPEIDSLFAGTDLEDSLTLAQVITFRGPRGFGAWLEAMERHGNSVNVGSYLGASTVRAYAMGQAEGIAGPAQLDTMRSVVRNAMRDGAFGISSALIYPPGSYAGTDELIAIAQAMAPLGGSYITHIRSEERGLLTALDEALRIGREGGVPVVVYHLKASGRVNWPLAGPAIAKLDSARAAGQSVQATMYPYPASGNNLSSCLPDWAHADGKLLENLRDPAKRSRVHREMMATGPQAPIHCQHNPPEAYQISGFRKEEWKRFEGRRLDEIAAALKLDWGDAIIDLTLGEENRLGKITFGMAEENVAMMLARPWVVIGSDAGGYDPDTTTSNVHPRSYGTFPRVLGKYARDEHIFSLEEAVRKMTWATARILGLSDRGLLAEGMLADIVIFDPAIIGDRATFEAPHQLSVGVRDVFVNGVAVMRNGTHTGATPGRAVRGPGWDGQRATQP